MKVTVEYPLSGSVRSYKDLTQKQANAIINQISTMNENIFVQVRITVEEE